ncbi:MAG: hypothetical protein WCG75_07970, partial [Armatimonadota bacterium]
MSISLAVALIMGQKVQTFKMPLYNADQKNAEPYGLAVTTLPSGFKVTGKMGSGEISSPDGTITVSLLKSKIPMPSLLRNPKLKELKDFTTIRMTKWIGYRNSNKNGEDYKLDWSRYRLNFSVVAKDPKKIGALREALHT